MRRAMATATTARGKGNWVVLAWKLAAAPEVEA
jgi:hypothetical protein